MGPNRNLSKCQRLRRPSGRRWPIRVFSDCRLRADWFSVRQLFYICTVFLNDAGIAAVGNVVAPDLNQPTIIPVPSSLLLFMTGLGFLWLLARSHFDRRFRSNARSGEMCSAAKA